MRLLRQFLGILSLLVGLALLGECAAHTMRSLWVQGIRQDLSLFLIKGAYFAPGRHAAAYQILLGSGVVLTLLGVVLTRAWALPFFLLGALCMAVLGGMTVERLVVPRGEEASLVQDGASGLGTLFSQAYASGRIGDPAMLLGLGVFGLLTGLYLTHGLKPRPVPVRTAPPRPARPVPEREPILEAPTPAFPEDLPPQQEEEPRADTTVDPDLAPESPELDTSEVQAPEPASLPEIRPAPLPEPGAEAPDEPEAEPSQEPPSEPPPPSGGRLLSALSLACALAAASAPAALLLVQIPDARMSLVWAGGTGLGLAGLGLGCLARPRRLPAKLGLGISGAGLLTGLALLGLGL